MCYKSLSQIDNKYDYIIVLNCILLCFDSLIISQVFKLLLTLIKVKKYPKMKNYFLNVNFCWVNFYCINVTKQNVIQLCP